MLVTVHGPRPCPPPASIDLVVFKIHLVPYDAARVATAPVTEAITLHNLTLVRDNPMMYSHNLTWGDLDMVQAEIAILMKQDQTTIIMVETSPCRRDGYMEVLLNVQQRWDARLMILVARHNFAAQETILPHVGIVGEITVEKGLQYDKMKAVLWSAHQDALRVGGAPILLHLKDSTCIDLVEEFAAHCRATAAQQQQISIVVSGAFHIGVIKRLFSTCDSNNMVFVIDQIGSSTEMFLNDDNNGTPIPCDEEVARQAVELLTIDETRFVLGLELCFATQLQCMGGDGLKTVRKCVDRLQRLGASPSAIQHVKHLTAVRLLSYFIPPTVTPVEHETWSCPICNKTVIVGVDEFWESHHERFCSSACMRVFRQGIMRDR